MATWLECSTLAEAEAVDAVAELFGRFGQGVAIEEPIVSSADGEQVTILRDRPVVVKTYVPCDERAEERRRRLEEGAWHLGRLRRVEPLVVRTLDEREWADAWKEHFFVHRVGERVVIVPSWRAFEPGPGDLPIHLDPGMAFGTGLHPTTRLCLRALERYLRGGGAVLDLGAGSGILSIAAAKLGAGRVLALDVEPVAVRVARENVERNQVQGRVSVHLGTLPFRPPGELITAEESTGVERSFDLAVANISFRVLSELHPELRRALRPGGVALLSGVLEADAPRLLASLPGAGWQLLEEQSEGDWALLVLSAEPA